MNSHRPAFRKAIDEYTWPNQAIRGAEIGVLTGATSAYLLEHIPKLHLICVDQWQEYKSAGAKRKGRQTKQAQQNENYETTRKALEPFGNRTLILRTTSEKAAKWIPDHTLDLAILDADHLYASVKADIAAWRHKIKPRGLFLFHDYGNHEPTWGVRRAVDEYAAEIGSKVQTGEGYVAWVIV